MSPCISCTLGGTIVTVQLCTPVPLIVAASVKVSTPLPVLTSVCWKTIVWPGTAVRKRGGDRLTPATCRTVVCSWAVPGSAVLSVTDCACTVAMSSVPESAEVGTRTVTVIVVLPLRARSMLDGATRVSQPFGAMVESTKVSGCAPLFLSVCV